MGLLLRQRLRAGDRVGRYGGEEFCVILPETDIASALSIAETLRALVATNPIPVESKRLAVTVSIGAAGLTPQMQATDLYRAADRMLYQAKNDGRNRVCGC